MVLKNFLLLEKAFTKVSDFQGFRVFLLTGMWKKQLMPQWLRGTCSISMLLDVKDNC
jgi:hypothetical protein